MTLAFALLVLAFTFGTICMMIFGAAALGGGISGTADIVFTVFILLTIGSLISSLVVATSSLLTRRRKQEKQPLSEKQIKSHKKARIALITSVVFIGSIYTFMYVSAYFARVR